MSWPQSRPTLVPHQELKTPSSGDFEEYLHILSPESYEYGPLPSIGWTRFLYLHPGTGKLVCSLTSNRIDYMTLKYVAISYAWGADARYNTVGIKCDGKALFIGSNLASALKHIRSKSRTKFLWADAICINQNDTNERSQQVQQMGDIFASASCVLVWVGEDSFHEAEECFATIRDAQGYLDGLWDQYGNIRDIPPISSL